MDGHTWRIKSESVVTPQQEDNSDSTEKKSLLSTKKQARMLLGL